MNETFNTFLVSDYHPALFILIGSYLILWIIKNILIGKLKKLSQRTETYLDDLVLECLEQTRHFFMLGTSVFLGFQAFHLDKKYGHIADKVFYVLIAMQLIVWGKSGITFWINRNIEMKADDPSAKTTFGFVGLILKFLFIAGVLLFMLNNLGVNVSTFIAGLGVGGIAIALATQNILGDLFASLSIVIDKPFIVGDFVSMGEWAGTIENVGLKTTRIRSISGEQVIVSNTDLLSSRIRNFKRMQERRIVFQLGVTYQVARADLASAPVLIENIIKAEKGVRFDRAHFFKFGESSLDLEIVYWVLSPEYNQYMDVHQKILLSIHENFEASRLSFAYPTRTIFLEKEIS